MITKMETPVLFIHNGAYVTTLLPSYAKRRKSHQRRCEKPQFSQIPVTLYIKVFRDTSHSRATHFHICGNVTIKFNSF